MIKIGIIGDFLKTAGVISSILQKQSISSKIVNYKHFCPLNQRDIDFMIIGINSPYTSSDYINKLKLNILIINDSFQITNLTVPPILMSEPNAILLNFDKANQIELKNNNPSYVITFGFNPKATITISSLATCTHNTMQISIQRTLKTLKNTEVLEQDFSVNICDNNVEAILAAISVIIVLGMDIEFLRDIVI